MTMNFFYTETELKELGFKQFGKNIKISRKASIYNPEKMIIGDNVRIDDFCILSGEITLSSHIHIAAFFALWGAKGICIEDFANLSSHVSVFNFPRNERRFKSMPPTVPLLCSTNIEKFIKNHEPG